MTKDLYLGDVAKFVRGINFKPNDVVPLGSDGSVACFRTKNVQKDLDLNDVWSVDRSFVKREEQFLREGDILVSTANSAHLVGRCCWVPELPWRASFGGFISVLRPNHERVDPRYLYRWFSSNRVQAKVRNFGRQTTNISNLSLELCLRLSIDLPSIQEQRRIADVLDRADALRAKRRAAIERLETLKQSIFLDMFGDPFSNPHGWPIDRVGEVAEQVRGVSYKKADASLVPRPGFCPVLRAGNIGNRELLLEDLVYVPSERIGGKQWLRQHDVLVATSSGSIDVVGKTIQVGKDLDAGFGAFCKVLRPSEKVDPIYFGAYFRTHGYRQRISAVAKGIGINNLKNEHLDDLPLPQPPVTHQRHFAALVYRIDERMELPLRAALQMHDELYYSVQDRAFTGAL